MHIPAPGPSPARSSRVKSTEPLVLLRTKSRDEGKDAGAGKSILIKPYGKPRRLGGAARGEVVEPKVDRREEEEEVEKESSETEDEDMEDGE